ncbi:MAG: TonB-dependent receptor [Rikenellaceae bacterium]
MKFYLLLLFSLIGVALFGQGYDSVVDSLEIEEIVVATNRVNKEVIPVQILSGESLKQLSAHSVADAVRYFSGVQIKDYGGVGGLKTVNIRSMGSHHVGVFYDGVELGNAQNGVVDLGRFSLDNMEAVSLYNGQKSAIFQTAKDYASASAIYMTTRKPTFDEEKCYNLNLGLKGGSFKTINPSILWEQRISSSLRSSVSAEYLYTSGEYPFTYSKLNGYDTTEIRKNGDVRYLRAEAALFGDIDHGEWQAKAYYYDSERGYPGASVREEPGLFQNADRQWDTNIFVQGSLRKSFSSLYSLKLNAKYANDMLHYISDPTTQLPVDDTFTQQELYASAANLFNCAPWLSFALSSDLQRNILDSDQTSFAYPRRITSLTSAATSITYNDLKFQGSLLYTLVNDDTQNGEAADHFSELTPTAIISYEPFDATDLNLRAFYKRVFRMPTLNDLYYVSVGSPSLEPELTTQYNIGATYKYSAASSLLDYLELQVDGYFNQVDNKIIATPTSNQFRWTMINLGYVEIRGVDLALNTHWSLGDVGISLRGNYTGQMAQDFTDPSDEDYGGQIPYIPWHSGSFIVGGDYCGWRLNYSFIYTGERYDSVANIAENYMQPWYTSDLSLSRDFSLKGVELRAALEVNNIMNQQYEVVKCYPMPGINYKIKINVIL